MIGTSFASSYASVKIAHIRLYLYQNQPIVFRDRIHLAITTPEIIIPAIVIFVLVTILYFILFVSIHFRRKYNIYVFYEMKRYFKEKRASKDDKKTRE
jgi:hypothetical protein